MLGHVRFSVLLVFLALTWARASFAADVHLANATWSVSLTPATLAVTATPRGGKPVQLSAPQAGLGTVGEVAASAEEAHWTFADAGRSVTVKLSGNALSVRLRANSPGQITWPVIVPGRAVRAYVLPLDEGSYVPVDNAAWLRSLTSESPMSTTEGLSMPFLGLDTGAQTVTYLLANPFHNALAFSSSQGRIAARVTHEFTRRSLEDYEVLVVLGPPSPIEPARQYRKWLLDRGEFVSLREKIARTPEAGNLLGAAHAYLWGDGVSTRMMEQLAAAGLDRLWLGLDSWGGGFRHPEAVRKAKDLGYLIATYDSYDSVHAPNEPDTWETAQFDRQLYETGAVIGKDGRPRRGFQQKGYRLSPLAVRPYVRERVTRLMKDLPERFNSWFIDCDAYGDLEDDYSPKHPATQQEDMQARLERMTWIRDTYGLVIGSERGVAYAAPVLHFAHGMMTPVIAWGDPDLYKRKTSPYYLGAWWPPDGPQIMVKQVPLKPEYETRYFDPRYRLPLYQTVFHDSLITAHHWQSASLKFRDQVVTTELMEVLYGVPPLYHLNAKEFAKHRARVVAHYRFFSPLHRETALLPMTDFSWVTADRLVQRTVFGDRVEVMANFTSRAAQYRGLKVPAHGVTVRWLDTGRVRSFTPAA